MIYQIVQLSLRKLFPFVTFNKQSITIRSEKLYILKTILCLFLILDVKLKYGMYMNYIEKSSLETNGSQVVFDNAVMSACNGFFFNCIGIG